MSTEPWSIGLRLSDLGKVPLHRRVEADDAARRRVADLLDLADLDNLSAEVEVAPWMDGAVVRGRWAARVLQTCGVSLEPFASDLDGDFEVRCVPAASPLAPAPEADVVLDPEAPDPPDVLEGEMIDLGAYVVEHLALELDPFPRKPGLAFEPPDEPPEPSPFAALAQLKPRS